MGNLKKILSLTICAAMFLCLAACGGTGTDVKSTEATESIIDTPTHQEVSDTPAASEPAESEPAESEPTTEVEAEPEYTIIQPVTERHTDKSQLPAGTGLKLAMIVPTTSQMFSIMIATGATDGVREGDTLALYAYEYDSAKFMSQIEDIVVQGVDGILMLSSETELATAVASVAKEAGIPIVAVENPVSDPSTVNAQILGDNYAMGWYGGIGLAEAVYAKTGAYDCKILTYAPTYMSAVAVRLEAFKEAIAQYPGMELVYNLEEELTVDGAMTPTENALTTYPEINAYWSCCDPPTQALVQIMEDSGRDDIVISTVECSLWVSKMLTEGKVAVGLDTAPYTTGWYGMETLYNVIFGGEYDQLSYVLPVNYTVDTMDGCATWQIEGTLDDSYLAWTN